jgi:hypothetical protein
MRVMTTASGWSKMLSMAAPQIPSTGEGWRGQPAPIPGLVDDMVACYASWREEAAAARRAYERWRDSRPDQEPARYAAYVAALDQEQSTAVSYAQAVSDLERWLRRPAARLR